MQLGYWLIYVKRFFPLMVKAFRMKRWSYYSFLGNQNSLHNMFYLAGFIDYIWLIISKKKLKSLDNGSGKRKV